MPVLENLKTEVAYDEGKLHLTDYQGGGNRNAEQSSGTFDLRQMLSSDIEDSQQVSLINNALDIDTSLPEIKPSVTNPTTAKFAKESEYSDQRLLMQDTHNSRS